MKGKLVQEKYHILKILTHNVFCETFLARDKRWFTRRRYIIKKIRPILGNPKVEEMRQMFYQEASILKRLSGENSQIPRLYEYFMDGEDFYLVREWIDGLTLQQKVEREGKFSAKQVEDILKSVLSFLKYIHSYNIVYRQLKPSTIVLRQNRNFLGKSSSYLPVPIYFGGVKELEQTVNYSYQYSLAVAHHQQYIPPEQEQGKSVFASDLYSLGLTAIYLLTGKNPNEFPLDPQTQQLLWHREIPWLKSNLVRVIDRATCSKIDQRYTSAEEMLEALNSPTISLSIPTQSSSQQKFTSEVKIIALLCSAGIGVLGLTFAILNFDLPQPRQDPAEQDTLGNSLPVDSPASLAATSSTARLPEMDKVPTFPLGMSQQSIIDLLGKPTSNSQGYWQNSRALLYEGIIPKKITLGYLTDINTTSVRQAEISFASSVDLLTIKQEAKRLLHSRYSPEVDHYINQIYFKTSSRQNFSISNLQGVVQRNPREHIYIAIWEKGFHQ